VLHEYNWPASASDRASAFSLVSKDSKVSRAIAVWIQDGALHYETEEGTVRSMTLESIDREATRKLNAESGLRLSLPPVTDSR